MRDGFVVGQIALAVVLAVAAGLLLQSLGNLLRTDPGFRRSEIVTFDLNLTGREYPGLERVVDFYAGLLEEIRALPGVTSAGMTSSLPLAEGQDHLLNVRVVGRDVVEGELPQLYYRKVGPQFFRTMEIQLIRGRPFSERDDGDSPGVVILNRAAAEMVFPGEDPVGRRLSLTAGNFGSLGVILKREVRIVGVVENARYDAVRAEPAPSVYLAHAQARFRRMTIVVRAPEPERVVGALRDTVASRDHNLPMGNVQTIEAVISQSMARDRFATTLVTVFSLIGVVLAAVGVYGVLSYTVSRRIGEIGVRMALGAGKRQIVRWVMGKSSVLIVVGVSTGIAAALFLARVLSSQLFGLSPWDATTFLVVSAAVVGTALLASLVPAARASRVDPMTALRHE